MKATTKNILITAMVLGLSGGAYAQAGGAGGGGAGMGGAGGGNSGSTAAPAAGMGQGGGMNSGGGLNQGTGKNQGMGGAPDGTAGMGSGKSGMSNDMNNDPSQGTMQRKAPNDSGTSSGSGMKKAY